MKTGVIAHLEVAREKSPFGYFLTDGNADVLLHYSQIEGELVVGQSIDVFLYHDSEDRLAATMKKTHLTLGQIGKLEVVDIHPKLGCFMDIGLDRHVLLPRSELPELNSLHPQVGDRLFVMLTHDKQGRLLAKCAKEKELTALASPLPESWKNKWLTGIVYNPLQVGTFVVVEDSLFPFGAIGMIHASDRLRPLRLGEQVSVRVSFVREDGRANFSLREVKQQAMDDDATNILNFLQERDGSMPYSDETPAELIKEKFQMSKSAFKRALGKLMKQGLIRQDRSWTYLLTTQNSEDRDKVEEDQS
jgi:predicted RNA-binding protein (virulence factor B family)